MSTWDVDAENRWYTRLIKLAREMAMEGRGQEAQDLRVAATHARNYRWLRDHSGPDGYEERQHHGVLQLRFEPADEIRGEQGAAESDDKPGNTMAEAAFDWFLAGGAGDMRAFGKTA